jgi:hypothetical protein
MLIVFVTSLLSETQEQVLSIRIETSIEDRAYCSSYAREDLNFIYIGNDFIEIVLNKANKGGIHSIVDKAIGTDFIVHKNAWWSMYDFCFVEGEQTYYLTGQQASIYNYQWSSFQNGVVLNLTWQFTTLMVSVKVSMSIYDNSSLTHWTMSLENHGSVTVEGVDFPALSGIGQISKDPINDCLVYPSLNGLLFQDPVHNFKKDRGWGWNMYYPSYYSTMQFIAYYSSENKVGLYLAASDTQGHAKFFNIWRPEDWLNVHIRYTPPISVGNDADVPYAVIVGIF